MTRSNAKTELAEHHAIDIIDPAGEFHLKTPYVCPVDADELGAAKTCKVKNRAGEQLDTLLVLDYGGEDLSDFCDGLARTTVDSDAFWLEAHRLIRGLHVFAKNGIVHNDIKPSNILYDRVHNRFAFIDFGLTGSAKAILRAARKSQYSYGTFHWSYPLESGFMNADQFRKFKQLSKERRSAVLQDLAELILGLRKESTTGIKIRADAFAFTFLYMGALTTDEKIAALNRFIVMWLHSVNTMTYDKIVQRWVKSVDSYGLGMTLKYVLDAFWKRGLINGAFYTPASELFLSMCDFDMVSRVSDPETIIQKYEDALDRGGVLLRAGGKFAKHKFVKETAPLSRMRVRAVRAKSKTRRMSQAKRREILDKDAVELLNGGGAAAAKNGAR